MMDNKQETRNYQEASYDGNKTRSAMDEWI